MKRSLRTRIGIVGLALVAAAISASPNPSGRESSRRRYKAAVVEYRRMGSPGRAVKAFLDSLPKVGGLFVIEGDMLMNETEVQNYLAAQAARGQLKPGPELKINLLPSGVRDKYDAAHRTLTYAIDRRTFSQDETFARVVENMAKATKAWEDACPTCGLRFSHQADQDASPSTTKVNFVVRNLDARGEYIAAAFFPHDPPARRFLNLDPSYQSTTFDKVGVLRHELGHVLGYRHEHIQGIPGCYREDSRWLPVTEYDPRSVMHYFCGGRGTLTLKLTPTDIRGHRLTYSPPQ